MIWKRIALSTALVAALAAAPFSKAEAHYYRNGFFPLFWPFAAAAAVVGTAATIVTAPFRAPYYYGYGAPAAYYPPPAAYYPPPAAYYPPPAQPYYGAPYYYGYR